MFGRSYHRNTASQNAGRSAYSQRPSKTAEMTPIASDTFSRLQAAIESGKLAPGDRQFALELRDKMRRYGGLTERQAPYAQKMIDIAEGNAPAQAERPRVEIGSLTGIMALFDKSKLKTPKVRLQLEDGTPVVLSKAGASARVPGSINVTDGGPFGANRWFGRLQKDGTWEKATAAGGIERELRELLVSFASDPAGVAAKYGKLTGGCSFCSTPLKDERSLHVGYGPTCAKNWGLPWGEK